MPRMRALLRDLSWFAAVGFGAIGARAQCGLQWLPGELTGADVGVSRLFAWDPDGAGPVPQRIVVAGGFSAIGAMPAGHIAIYDPGTGLWGTFGSGASNGQSHYVGCVAAMGNGDLVVGGYFWSIDGVPASNLARFDGTTWSAFPGSGPNGVVHDVAVAPNGDLWVVGAFTSIGSTPAYGVARWDGTAWADFGTGFTPSFAGPQVSCVLARANGEIVVGGTFSQAGGVAAANIAMWNGSQWSSLGSGSPGAVVTVAELANGDLVAGAVAPHPVARWNGANWSSLGSAQVNHVLRFLELPNGHLLAGGQDGLAEWNGVSWTSLGSMPGGYVRGLVPLPNGDLMVGGWFVDVAGTGARCLARRSGTVWSAFVSANAFDGAITSFLTRANGELLALGSFSRFGNTLVVRLARWSSGGWLPVPGSAVVQSETAAAMPNGDVVFRTNLTFGGLVRWDGTNWSPYATALSPLGPSVLAALPNGDLIAAGPYPLSPSNYLVRWDGTVWSSLGAGIGGPVSALQVLDNGDLVVGGSFTVAGGAPANGIARWNGTAWSRMDQGLAALQMTGANRFRLRADGVLLASGPAGGAASQVVQWDGSQWLPIGGAFFGQVRDLLPLPNGDVLATGSIWFVNGPAMQPAQNIARWHGATWTPVGAAGLAGEGRALTMLPSGEVFCGGTFLTAGGLGSAYLARLASDCPATAGTYGSPCSGSAGPVALAMAQLPWLGSTSRSVATGLAPNGFAFGLAGFAPTNVSLASFHPAALPNCSVFTIASATVWLPVTAGIARFDLAVPNDPGLVGITLFEQVVQAELGASGNLVALSSSNGLQLTIGAQ